MDTRFTGVIPPVVTPLNAAGQVDDDSLDRLVDHLLNAGVNGLFLLGSTAETAYLTDRQRDQIVDRVVKRANGAVPIIVGAIDMTAHRVIDHAKRAEALGADAIVSACPFYAINDVNEISDHFRAIAQAIPLPLFAYDVPVRLNRVKLSRDMLIQLGVEGTLAGVKDSSGDDVGFRRLVMANEDAGHPLSLLTGHECVVDGMLLLGADGVVPGYANIDPVRYVDMWRAAQVKDWEKARQLQDEICRGFEIVFTSVGRSGDAAGVGAFKTAMRALGIIETNQMCFPVKALDGEVVAQIEQIVRDHIVG